MNPLLLSFSVKGARLQRLCVVQERRAAAVYFHTEAPSEVWCQYKPVGSEGGRTKIYQQGEGKTRNLHALFRERWRNSAVDSHLFRVLVSVCFADLCSGLNSSWPSPSASINTLARACEEEREISR